MNKMKCLFLIGVLSVMNVCAQDFKVKKGELLSNGTPVAKIEKKDGKYQFSDLSNHLLYRVVLTAETAQGNLAPHRWIEFSNANGVIRVRSTCLTVCLNRGLECSQKKVLTLRW